MFHRLRHWLKLQHCTLERFHTVEGYEYFGTQCTLCREVKFLAWSIVQPTGISLLELETHYLPKY